MKIKDIVRYIDSMANIIIWENVSIREERWEERWEEVYTGPLLNMPWYFLEKNLIEAKDNEGDEAICPCIVDDKPVLRITLGKDDEV